MTTLKRFRPSGDSICSYERCTESPSTVPCAHCPSIFCLQHLFEHQRLVDIEQKRLLMGIENCRTRLKTVRFSDNRHELFQQLDELQKGMAKKLDKMKTEVNDAYEQCEREFNDVKENLLKNDDNQDDRSFKKIWSDLEQSLQALNMCRMKLIIAPSTPMIRVLKPNFNSPVSYVQCTTQPNLEKLLVESEPVFTLDYGTEADGVIFSTSPKHLVIYKGSASIFQLFNHLGEHLCDINYDSIDYGALNQITWSSSLNEFLLATSKQLLRLNCHSEYIQHYDGIGSGFYKDVCAGGDSILLVHHLGTSLGDVIEHYSNNQLIQRCWKSDLYPDDTNEIMNIESIEMSRHLLAIYALRTDQILVCDILHSMKFLFRIQLNGQAIFTMCPVYDTQQWLLFIIQEQDDSYSLRWFVANALENDPKRRVHQLTCDDHSRKSIWFFGPNHFILIGSKSDFECRKISH